MSLNPRFIEAVGQIYPQANTQDPSRPLDVVVMDNSDGNGTFVSKWNNALGPIPTEQQITDALAAKDAIKNAETARVASFSNDVDAADLLSKLKTVDATQIDNYVNNNVTLTSTSLAGFRSEVEGTLRAITKRELKIMALMARSISS